MSELDDLLEMIAVPPTEAAADATRGERSLRRRRRVQVGAAAVSVAAVAGVGFALHGSSGAPGAAPGYAGQPGSSSGTAQEPATQHSRKPHHPDQTRAVRPLHHRFMALAAHDALLRTYHDVLAEHLDPTGEHLRLAQNEQGGAGVLGTKLDWNGGGMLEIVVGRSWSAAGGFYLLESAGMKPTTYAGRPARVSTRGGDVVVSAEHADGTVVTLIASTSFGNNGTSTPTLGLTQHQLLGAAADPRLSLPPGLR